MKRTLAFLRQLSSNNNRDWFHANKAEFDAAKKEVVELSAYVNLHLGKQMPEILREDPAKALFRIYRDTRFSNDKTPYKINQGFWFAPGNKQDIRAGFYVHIQPNASFIAAGVWMPPSPQLQAIRQEIHFQHEALRNILNHKQLKKEWGALGGDQLKTVPKGFEKDHPAIDLLKFKSLVLTKDFSDTEIQNEAWRKAIVSHFETAIPFVRFLNAALEMSE